MKKRGEKKKWRAYIKSDDKDDKSKQSEKRDGGSEEKQGKEETSRRCVGYNKKADSEQRVLQLLPRLH
jgi:hypothetical protein